MISEIQPAAAAVAPPPGPVLLEAGDLRKTYAIGPRKLEVLRGVSLTVRRGEVLALRGASGAGKSTLLRLLGGLDSPNAGDIIFAGTNLAALSRRSLAHGPNPRIGFIFQAYPLCP